MEINTLLTSVLHFSLYFGVSLLFLVTFKYVYKFITPHDEWKLIKEEQNIAAATWFWWCNSWVCHRSQWCRL